MKLDTMIRMAAALSLRPRITFEVIEDESAKVIERMR
jgi:hypothetical protein